MKARSKSRTARFRLPRGGLLAAFLLVLLSLPFALLGASAISDTVFVSVLVAGVLLLTGGLIALFLRRRDHAPKIAKSASSPAAADAAPSADLRLVASRLISVEKRVAVLAGSRSEHGDATLAELTGDLGLLSGLVRGLADALGQQERELAELSRTVDRLSRQEPAAAPVTRRPDHEAARHPAARAAADLGPGLARDGASRRAPSFFPTALPEPDAEPATASERPAETPAGPARRQAIAEAVEAGRIELHLQPIVSLPQRHTRGYEILARLRLADGGLLTPGEFLPALERDAATGRLDEQVMARVLAVAAELEPASREVRLTCNVAPSSLANGRFLAALERMVAAAPTGARRTVIELPQRAWRALPAGTPALLGRLRAAGLALSMDRVGELAFDDLTVMPVAPEFIKVPCDLILRGIAPDRAAATLGRLRDRDIRVIVDRVESERDIPDLIDLDIPLAQGFVFGSPRPLVSSDTNPASDTNVASKPGAAADAPQRLRDVLRRAG